MKTIEQIALEVAKDTPNDMHEEAWIVWFATKLIAAWQEQQTSKPAGYTLIVNGARQGLYAFKHDAMEKGMEIGARFDLLPLYLASPPAVQGAKQ